MKLTVSITDSNIALNGKTNSPPTTKDHLPKKFKVVFEDIFSTRSITYTVEKDYNAVQHIPCQVAVSLKTA